MRSVLATGLPSLTSRSLAFIGTGVLCLIIQFPACAETADALFRQCRDKPSTAEQRSCYPAIVKQSEIELVATERKARFKMVELETISEGSRAIHPARAFDRAARAFRAFRDAESMRVLASYGSGNGGDLAASAVVIEMNINRAKLLATELPNGS